MERAFSPAAAGVRHARRRVHRTLICGLFVARELPRGKVFAHAARAAAAWHGRRDAQALVHLLARKRRLVLVHVDSFVDLVGAQRTHALVIWPLVLRCAPGKPVLVEVGGARVVALGVLEVQNLGV